MQVSESLTLEANLRFRLLSYGPAGAHLQLANLSWPSAGRQQQSCPTTWRKVVGLLVGLCVCPQCAGWAGGGATA